MASKRPNSGKPGKPVKSTPLYNEFNSNPALGSLKKRIRKQGLPSGDPDDYPPMTDPDAYRSDYNDGT